MSADELFAKILRRFAACLLVNNNSCGKLVSSLKLAMVFDDHFKTNSVLLFIAYLNFLSCEFDIFTFKLKSKTVSFAFFKDGKDSGSI